MSSQNKSIRFITRAAMGIALVILAQLIGNKVPQGAAIVGQFKVNQLITGSLVNCVLFVFTAVGGTWCGVVIGILSALLAAVIRIGPKVPAITPLIACGNAILCLVFALVSGKLKAPGILGVITAAVVKCGFLWLSVPLLLQALEIAEPQRTTLTVMFSWPQGCTALIGGLLAIIIIPRVLEAIKS